MKSNSSTRARLRSVKPEEGVTRERYLGVNHILGRKVSVRQIMSGLSVATCMERSERRPRIFEVHTFNEEVGEEALGAGCVGEGGV